MFLFRKAAPEDLDGMMTAVRQARSAIAKLGIDQWQDGYPSEALIREDIAAGRAYVCVDAGSIAGLCVLISEPEPTYQVIDGAWHIGEPYLTIHRIAVDDAHRHQGAAKFLLDNAFDLAKSLGLTGIRADTHRGNAVMRRFMEKNGFRYCGIITITVEAGDPLRVAYDCPLREA